MSDWFHVSASANRASIQRHGLDWTRMGVARGIAGSLRPEQEGCFLADGERTADYFVAMNNTGGPVDVWAVRGVEESALVISGEGYPYLPARVPPHRLVLLRRDLPQVRR